jgi:nucleotide-binding universal stress UspA family protein
MYSTVLAALDGSEQSARGGEIALLLCRALGARLLACHVYGAQLHGERFGQMELDLPKEYRRAERLDHLRGAHGSLIVNGFQSLSLGYMEDYVERARKAGVEAEMVTVEGRAHRQLVRIARERQADLLVTGSTGLGAIGDGLLGGTSSRVLRHAPCDVLVARSPLTGGPVMVGIDGSEAARNAARKASSWARALDRPLQLAAAYDPDFHRQVFHAMAQSLSAGRQDEVGLAAQQHLHDRLINDGLAALYRRFLDGAGERLGDPQPSKVLLEGKAYAALNTHASQADAAMIVVGRAGHHYESGSLVGSTAEAVARLCPKNVLVTTDPSTAAPPQAEQADA